MATTQDERLLKISTPLGRDFLLVNWITASEGLSQLFSIEAELLHEEDEEGYEPTLVDASRILGKNVTIEVSQKDGAGRFFNGIVNSFSQGTRHSRFSFYRVTIVPQVWTLTQNIQSRIFQHKSVPQIITEVLEGLNIKNEIQGDFKPRNYCAQYRESDWDFISRLMEEEGIYYFFEHEDTSHRLILGNDPRSHRNCPRKNEIPYYHSVDEEDFVSSIFQWSKDHRLMSGKVTFWDYNFELPTNKLDAEQPSRFNIGGNQELEIYDFPGGYAKRFDGIDKGGGERQSDLQNIFTSKTAHAEIAMQALDAQHETGSGMSDCSSLTAGHLFKMFNHPNSSLNGQYVVTSAAHSSGQTPSYVSDQPGAPYQVSFTALAHGAGKPPFRPQHATPKPIIHGTQTAVVVGPAGEEIFTDKYGRIKVQFNWDRMLRFDPDSSCWVRVARDIAGNKWGSMYIPRIGQEVIVDFEHGDPDKPIVVGSVYNPQTMPHYELPKFKTLTYIKTRTSPDDGKGYNELRFEDKANKEQVFIRSQKRYDLRVRGSMYETCGGSRHEVIGLKQEDQPGGNLAVTVAGNYDLHVKESMYIGIDGKLNEAVKGEVVEDYQSSLSTMVKTKAELNAMEITLEAKSKISLKVGGNCIMLDPSGITIAGTMVKINSGGFASGVANATIDDPLDAEVSDNGKPGYLEKPRTGTGHRGRNRRTLTGQHYVAPPRPGEDARITAMRNTLANSEQGRHALEVYDRYGVNPTFRPGEGSTFDSGTNTTNLDPSEDSTTSALTFVHEMQHAQEHHEGTSGDITNQPRDQYVDEMLQEEVDGTVRSIEARNELAASGTDVSNSHFPLENEYQQAHDQAIADARAANPSISDQEAEEIGRAAGRQRVEDGFRNGEVVTSNTNESYPDYYGDSWDDAHPGGGGGTP